MKNIMKEIAALLGVEIGERFRVRADGKKDDGAYYVLHENGLFLIVGENEGCIHGRLADIFTGKAEIIKLPWRPKPGETCYCLTYDSSDNGWYVTAFTWDGDIADISLFAMGNCFPTEEELLAHEDEIIQRYSNAWEGIN